MKHRFSEAFVAASIVLSISLITAGCGKTVAQTEEAVLTGADSLEGAAEWVEVPASETDAGTNSETVAATPDVEGSVSPVSFPNETVLPAGLKRGGPFSDIVRMADSGLEESVLLAYIGAAHGTFAMGPEEIIFLKDIGVSSEVVKAMIEHDHLINGSRGVVAENRLPFVTQINFPAASAPVVDTLPGTIPRAVYEIPGTLPDENQMDLIGDEPSPPMVEIIGDEPKANPDFYRELAPYGSWVDVEGSGRCWKPTVAAAQPDWRPYCDCGHWVMTESGWYWRSDYSWGWAPFHYGRWFHHSTAGWCWRPDQVWGPAWVAWRSSPQYCGWAPLPPAARFIRGRGLFFHGVAATTDAAFGLGPNVFRFVPWNRFLSASLASRQPPVSQASHVFADSHPATAIIFRNDRVVNTHPGAWEHLTRGRTTVPAIPLPQVAKPSSLHQAGLDGDLPSAMHEPSGRANAGSFEAPEFRNEVVTASLALGNRESAASLREREAAIRRGAPPNSLIVLGARNLPSAHGQTASSALSASRLARANPQTPNAANLTPTTVALNDTASIPWWARPTPPAENHSHNSRETAAPWNASSVPRGHTEPAFAEPVHHNSQTAEATTHTHHQAQEIREATHTHVESPAHSEAHAAAAPESHASSHSSSESSKESHSSSVSSEHHGR